MFKCLSIVQEAVSECRIAIADLPPDDSVRINMKIKNLLEEHVSKTVYYLMYNMFEYCKRPRKGRTDK